MGECELEGLLKGDVPTKSNEVEEEEEEIIKEDLVQKVLTMIQDKVDKLAPWQMQDLVAGLQLWDIT